MRKIFSIFAATLLCLPMMQAAIKVHTIGDSTMAEYDESTTDKRGWGMYLGSFFDPAFVTVNNRGKSGADTRFFYTDPAYWTSVKAQMSEGDYLIIQFAHNDEGTVTNGMDNLEYAAYCAENGKPAPTDSRGTNPQTTYRDYLRLFIDEARALGVNPILVAPICRKYFSGNMIRRNGQHDLGDKFSKIENGVLYENQRVPATDLSMSYVEAMRIVAVEKEVPFINLTEATRDLYLEYGETQCTQLLFCNGDNTHTNAMGGNLIARQAAQMLKEAGILAEYITIPTSISANPASIAIGETYSGITLDKEFLLTGFGLEPESGAVELSATGDLTISTDKETYGKTASIDYTGGSLFQKVFVRVSYTGEGVQNDSIVVTFGDNSLSVSVTASVISMEGGSAVSASWAMNEKPLPEAVVEGPVGASISMNHMMVADIKNDVKDSQENIVTVARFHNADDSGAKANWPATEIDENPTRYIDFAVSAPATMEIRITGISFEIGAYSTGSMKCHINTGFGDSFTGVKTIYEAATTALTNIAPITDKQTKEFVDYGNPMQAVALTPVLTIPAGETLHVRVLPWHEHTSGSGKYLCLRNVKIEGMAFEPEGGQEGIELTSADIKTSKIIRNGQILILRGDKIYTLTGQELK